MTASRPALVRCALAAGGVLAIGLVFGVLASQIVQKPPPTTTAGAARLAAQRQVFIALQQYYADHTIVPDAHEWIDAIDVALAERPGASDDGPEARQPLHPDRLRADVVFRPHAFAGAVVGETRSVEPWDIESIVLFEPKLFEGEYLLVTNGEGVPRWFRGQRARTLLAELTAAP